MTCSISASLIAGIVAAASLILYTAKIGKNTLQKEKILLPSSNKQTIRATRSSDNSNSVPKVQYGGLT